MMTFDNRPPINFDNSETVASADRDGGSYQGIGCNSYRVYRATDPSSAGAFVDVTAEDGNHADTRFLDTTAEPLAFYLVTGVGPNGEGPKGHFGD